jgi:hypothetical protein
MIHSVIAFFMAHPGQWPSKSELGSPGLCHWQVNSNLSVADKTQNRFVLTVEEAGRRAIQKRLEIAIVTLITFRNDFIKDLNATYLIDYQPIELLNH